MEQTVLSEVIIPLMNVSRRCASGETVQEEVVLSEVIIPLMNVSRRCASGETVQEEVLNKSQIYITTAGWKGTFSYDKLIQILIWQILKPGTAAVLGGTWRKKHGMRQV